MISQSSVDATNEWICATLLDTFSVVAVFAVYTTYFLLVCRVSYPFSFSYQSSFKTFQRGGMQQLPQLVVGQLELARQA